MKRIQFYSIRESWRWFSVQCLSLALAIELSWAAVPLDLKERIPEAWADWLVTVLLVLGVIGRHVKQGGSESDADSNQ